MTIGCRDFDSSGSEYGEVSSAIVSSPSWTFACWIKPASVGAGQTVFSIATSGSANHHYLLDVAAAGIIRFRARDTGSNDALTEGEVSFGAWNFVACRVDATNSRSCWLDSEKATTTGSRNPAGMDRTAIGRSSQGSGASYFTGRIAMPCVWGVALSDSEIAALAGGAHPSTVEGGSIVALWPFDGSDPEPDATGDYPLDMHGSTYVADDPPPIAESSATYEESLTEGLTAGDSLSAGATFPASLAEGLAAGDSVAASVGIPASLAEGSTPGDSLSSSASLAASLAESPTPGDSLSSTAVLSPTLEESLTAQDAVGAALEAGEALGEGLTADDALAAAAAFTEGLAEGLTAGDSCGSSVDGAPQVYEEELAEALTAGDFLSSTASVASSLSEGLAASDSLEMFIAVPATLSEGLAAGDSVDALAAFSAGIIENLIANLLLSSTAEYSEEIREPLTAGDSYAAAMEGDPAGFGLVWAALPSRAHWSSRGERPQWEAPGGRLHWTVPG